MKIKNIENLTVREINHEIDRGGRFVVFQYALSALIITSKRNTDIYFIKAGEPIIKYSIGFILLSLLFGWWGFPWGPIYTIGTVFNNLLGGKDVTAIVQEQINEGHYR